MSRTTHTPRSPLARRLAITAAAGALVTAAAVVPAAAAASDEWGDDPGTSSYRDDSGDPYRGGGRGGHEQGRYRGVVTADRLALRGAPNRGSEIIRYAHRGETVHIYCKTGGESVKGNPLWYLLTDGTWAWGAARHIDNIGPAPRWC